jgi:D-alanyl-lipoteichoic acid acyltransferase DltB (MBOAT superfamily)
LGVYFVGISYMAFRLSHLVREVQNKVAPLPGISEYLAFAFFVPTILVGPISPFSKMHSSLQGRGPGRDAAPTAWLRLLIGFTKYIFLASIASQFTYAGFLLDGHPHSKMDLAIAIVAYTIYLYCNFSGFCDMVIGISALLGIDVAENFNRPFTSRNLQEFWNRWHMTLSSWLRDFMFTPMLKALVRLFGPASLNAMTAFTIISVFVVIGIWHGTGLNYALFGLWQGVGLAVVHYYTVFLKRVLGKQRYLAYEQNPFFRYLGITMTCAYFSLSLFFFANSLDDMRLILHTLS